MPEFIQAIVMDDEIDEVDLRKLILRHRARRLFIAEKHKLELDLRIDVQRFRGDLLKELVIALGPGPNLILAPQEMRRTLVEALQEAAVPVSEV